MVCERFKLSNLHVLAAIYTRSARSEMETTGLSQHDVSCIERLTKINYLRQQFLLSAFPISIPDYVEEWLRFEVGEMLLGLIRLKDQSVGFKKHSEVKFVQSSLGNDIRDRSCRHPFKLLKIFYANKKSAFNQFQTSKFVSNDFHCICKIIHNLDCKRNVFGLLKYFLAANPHVKRTHNLRNALQMRNLQFQ